MSHSIMNCDGLTVERKNGKVYLNGHEVKDNKVTVHAKTFITVGFAVGALLGIYSGAVLAYLGVFGAFVS